MSAEEEDVRRIFERLLRAIEAQNRETKRNTQVMEQINDRLATLLAMAEGAQSKPRLPARDVARDVVGGIVDALHERGRRRR